MMSTISLKAYAKVNLSLDVTGKLKNGYHTLRSVMQAVNLFDEIVVTVSEVATCSESPCYEIPARGENSVNKDLVCENSKGYEVKLNLVSDSGSEVQTRAESEIPDGSDNLACKAAEKMIVNFRPDLQSTSGRKYLIQIDLNKKIPVAAGLAGGSTDAAAVMLALANLWDLKVNLKELIGVAKTIGADVPFCLIANARNNLGCGLEDDRMAYSTALAEGIGEELSPLPSIKGSLIFVKQPISLSTPVVYSLYDEREHLVTQRPDTEELLKAFREFLSGILLRFTFETNSVLNDADSMARIKKNMINVLEPVVRSEYPVVAETLDALTEAIPDGKVFMSGSGPTVVVFFDNDEDASKALPTVERLFSEKAGIYKMNLL